MALRLPYPGLARLTSLDSAKASPEASLPYIYIGPLLALSLARPREIRRALSKAVLPFFPFVGTSLGL